MQNIKFSLDPNTDNNIKNFIEKKIENQYPIQFDITDDNEHNYRLICNLEHLVFHNHDADYHGYDMIISKNSIDISAHRDQERELTEERQYLEIGYAFEEFIRLLNICAK